MTVATMKRLEGEPMEEVVPFVRAGLSPGGIWNGSHISSRVTAHPPYHHHHHRRWCVQYFGERHTAGPALGKNPAGLHLLGVRLTSSDEQKDCHILPKLKPSNANAQAVPQGLLQKTP